MNIVAPRSNMYTYARTWLAIGVLLVSLMRAQSPWTNWNVYADSTGNGANPVTGLTPVCPDTFWLIVDTAGMGAAGINGWRWQLVNIPTANVVYDGTSNPPYFFPPAGGVSNVRKLGVSFNTSTPGAAVLLKVFYSSGDSAGITKALPLKATPSVNMLSPNPSQIFCPGASVNFSFNVVGADSFKIGYGPNPTDTVRNQLTFSATAPNLSSWTIHVIAYSCGGAFQSFNLLYLNPAMASLSLLVSPGYSVCPGSGVTFSLSPWSDITGSTGVTLTVTDPGNNTVYTATSLPSTWNIPTSALSGSYTAQLQVTYPCGTATVPAYFTVIGSGSLTPPTISPNNVPYCTGAPITLFAGGAQGLVSWDIGNDGTWDYVGSSSIVHTFNTIPPGGIPIKIKQDIGCDTREDVITWNRSGLAAPLASGWTMPPSLSCPGQTFQVELNTNNFSLNQSGATLQWQAAWLNGGSPFPGYSLDTILPGPPTSGSHTLNFTLTNSCGTYNGTVNVTVSPTFSTPNPIVLGSVCSSGGTVGVVIPASIMSQSIQSIRYLSSSGTVVATANPGDTVSITVPSGGASLTVEYIYPCGKAYNILKIIPSSAPAVIQNSFITSNVVCPGTSINVSAFGQNGQQMLLYYNNQLVAQMPVSITSPPFFNANMPFTVPNTSGTLLVVITGCGGNDSVSHSITVQSSGAVAAFSAPASACVGQPVTFQRTGGNANLYSTLWDFGDNTSSIDTALSVSHTYTQPGTYTVFLQVQSTCGYTFAQKTIKIYGGAPSLSGLNINQSGNAITGTVNATDADSVKWFFNAPNATPSASGTSVSHTYAATGTYTVMVVAYNPCGTDTLTQTVNVTSTSATIASRSGEWTLYPNPARSEVFLMNPAYPGAAQVRIFDVQGRLVETHAVQSFPARLSLNLPTGLYQVQLITERGVETLRLAVE